MQKTSTFREKQKGVLIDESYRPFAIVGHPFAEYIAA
jgi:hypothetical protein